MSRFSMLAILALLVLTSAMFFGGFESSPATIVDCLFNNCPDDALESILWDIRVPRILAGFLAGMGLSLAGTLLQNTTQNALADPYLFGIVSGAALGVVLATALMPGAIGVAMPVAAFAGAFSAIVLVIMIGQLTARYDQLLLVGVAVSFMFGALSQLVLFLSEPYAANRILFWLLGSLASIEPGDWIPLALAFAMALLVTLLLSRQADALLMGDELAKSLGVPVVKVKLALLLVSALVTAIIVSYCGGIAFVGLMVPHMARYWFGSTTRDLAIGASLMGGCFLVTVDVLARTLLDGQELPIGVITSVLGSLFFLGLLKRRSHN